MRFKLSFLIFVLLISLTFVSSSFALRSDPADSREIVVYTRNISEINEIRTVEIEKGTNTIALPMITVGVIPGSVELEILKPSSIGTQFVSFSQDLFDLTKYWRSRIGEEVELFLKDDSVATIGVLKQVNDKHLFLEPTGKENSIQLIKRSDLKEIAIENIPAEMVMEPSFLWKYKSSKNGKAKIRLKYLSRNISWNGEHNVKINEDKAEVYGSFVVENHSGVSLPYDKLILVGGAIHLAGDKRRVDRLNPKPGAIINDSDSQFGDVRRWIVEEKGLLHSGHSSVITLIDENNQAVDRSYIYDATIFDDRVSSHIKLTLDSAFPGGKVRIHEKLGKEVLFIGEDKIDDTPAGSEMNLNIGQVFDLSAERIRKQEVGTSEGGTSQTFTVILGNSSNKKVNITVLERLFGDWEISNADVDGSAVSHTIKDARTASFEVPVPAGKTVNLNYEIRYVR